MDERYSRQAILSGVGAEGQEKWGKSRVVLAGEGLALEAAAAALASSGIGQLSIIRPNTPDAADWKNRFPNTHVECLDPSSSSLPPCDLALVLTGDADFRRRLGRLLRRQSQPVLSAWAAGSGYALFLSRHAEDQNGKCPCLECFEVMNPKAFSKAAPQVERLLAAAAVSEALLWLLSRQSSLDGKVWITSLETGVSFHHEVCATPKCPAKLTDEGATITP
jgi:hypothetical protein